MAGVVTDIMGKFGRDILAALPEGTAAAATMAQLARGQLRRKREALERALDGRMSVHHRLLIALHLAQVGLDVVRFPSASHLASWAGMCPGNEVSAGKCKTGKRRQGNQALRRALTEAARAAARTTKKDQTYLRGQYRRLGVRLGKKKAAVGIGHTILRIVYHLLAHETTYQEHELCSSICADGRGCNNARSTNSRPSATR